MGAYLRAASARSASGTASIASVRGRGLLLGVELVATGPEPDPELAARVLDGVRDRGVLIGSTGPARQRAQGAPAARRDPGEADLIVAAIDATIADAVSA